MNHPTRVSATCAPLYSVGLYVGEALKRYAFGDPHPFGPDRLDAFWNCLSASGLDQRLTLLKPVSADLGEVERFHTIEHIERVRTLSRNGKGCLDAGDTPAFRGILEAGLLVVGSTLDACRRIARCEFRRIFIPIAGLHHARRGAAAGFCAFNDIGVAIEALRAEHSVSRIGYVDIDAHHGDGVYYGFEDDPDVLVADLHEDGRFLYPGSGLAHEVGRGRARGSKLNIEMPPGAGDAEFMTEWPRVEAFLRNTRPEFLIFQCGADSIAGDPITHLRYTPAAHRHAAASLCRIADELGHGKLLALGGGGYNRTNLALAWTEVVRAMVES